MGETEESNLLLEPYRYRVVQNSGTIHSLLPYADKRIYAQYRNAIKRALTLINVRNVGLLPVLRIRIRMFLGLLDPDPDQLVRGTDPDPSFYHQAKTVRKTLISTVL
jgi:hypothetical protein